MASGISVDVIAAAAVTTVNTCRLVAGRGPAAIAMAVVVVVADREPARSTVTTRVDSVAKAVVGQRLLIGVGPASAGTVAAMASRQPGSSTASGAASQTVRVDALLVPVHVNSGGTGRSALAD